MIEVRTVHHVGVLELRIRALDHADDVLGELRREHLEGVVDVDGDLHVGERERRQRLALDGAGAEIGELRRRVAEQKLPERVVAGDLRRHDAVDAIRRLVDVGRDGGLRRAPAARCGASSTCPARARASPTALRLRDGRLRVGDGLIRLRQGRLRFCERLVRCGRRRRRGNIAQDGGRAERLDHVIGAIATAAPAATAGCGLDRRAARKPRDESSLHFAAAKIVMVGRQIHHAVAGEIDTGEVERLFPARVGRERHVIAVLEGPGLAAHLHGHRGIAGDLVAAQLDGLKVAGIADRLDAELLQLLCDEGGRQAIPFGEHLPALEGVRGEVGQPLARIRFTQRRELDLREGGRPAPAASTNQKR